MFDDDRLVASLVSESHINDGLTFSCQSLKGSFNPQVIENWERCRRLEYAIKLMIKQHKVRAEIVQPQRRACFAMDQSMASNVVVHPPQTQPYRPMRIEINRHLSGKIEPRLLSLFPGSVSSKSCFLVTPHAIQDTDESTLP